MKRVLSIQDLSCVGKCSLTFTLPVLSAMQCECAVLPTAILSTHTAFPAPHCRSLTGEIAPICRHWQSIGASFDAVSVGYLADPVQVDAIQPVLDTFGSLVIIDPAMGDHGRLYSRLTADHIPAMAQLCRRGHVLLPNVTEAALLTGLPYLETTDPGYYRELTAGMLDFGAEAVVITGVSLESEKTGFTGAHRKTGSFSYQVSRIPRQLHGTGDLFSAVFTGALSSGQSVSDAATFAAQFTERVLSATEEVSPFGAKFESQLPWLWENLRH